MASLKITPTQHAALKALAAKRGVRVSTLVRDKVRELQSAVLADLRQGS